VRQAYIFGSWARRIRDPAGAPGPPRDLDLVVVGDPRPDEVYAACARAEETLRLAVDPVIVTVDAWEGGTADAAMRGVLDAVKAEQPIALLEDRVP
jgi:hypothetical protein